MNKSGLSNTTNQLKNLRSNISLEFAPDSSNLALIRSTIDFISTQLGYSESESLQLVMAVDEACSNSINAIQEIEGNNVSAYVRVEITICQNCLRLTVIDNGRDFSTHFNKAVPFHEKTIRTKKRGYGLQIIKTLMDEVHYIREPKTENKLILTKYLPGFD